MLQAYDLTADRVIRGEADFLRYDNQAHVAIRVRADGQDLGLLWPGETLELQERADLWEIKGAVDGTPATGSLRIGTGRIRSARRAQLHRVPVLVMETGVNPVPAITSAPGWVSGDVANLAAAATATVVFDLGADWAQYTLLEVIVDPKGPSSGLNPVQFFGSDTTAVNSSRRRGALTPAGVTAWYSNFAQSGGPQLVPMRVAGRYLVISAINGDASNAMGPASKITLIAYPSS